MALVPTNATRLAGTAAVNCTSLTKVVVRFTPLHCTMAPLRKFVPLTVSVKAGLPTGTVLGTSAVMVGKFDTEARLPEIWNAPLDRPLAIPAFHGPPIPVKDSSTWAGSPPEVLAKSPIIFACQYPKVLSVPPTPTNQ